MRHNSLNFLNIFEYFVSKYVFVKYFATNAIHQVIQSIS